MVASLRVIITLISTIAKAVFGRFFSASLLIVLLICWLSFGQSLYTHLEKQTPEQFVDESIKRVRELDPKAGAELERIKEQRGARALAAALRASGAKGDTQDSVLRGAATDAIRVTECNARLVALAERAQLVKSGDDLEDFIRVHAVTCQMLAKDPSPAALDDYLQRLEAAHEEPRLWSVVMKDPAALMIWPALKDKPDLWEYYSHNEDWLSKTFVELCLSPNLQPPDVADGRTPSDKMLVDEVEVARRYDPLPRMVVEDLKLGAAGFSLFRDYGGVIASCRNDYGMPLEETLNVIFANRDFAKFAEEKPRASVPPFIINVDHVELPGPEEDKYLAGYLSRIAKNKPIVWHLAQSQPKVLRLNYDSPEYAAKVLENFPGDDVTTFLYDYYPNEILPASMCLAKYKDLGFYFLNKFHDDRRMHTELADPKVGFRIIPVLATQGDGAFDKIIKDPRWVPEFVDDEGYPNHDSNWIASVPLVGGPINVLNKFARNRPLEWSELGWAGVDLADDALLIASCGATSELAAVDTGTDMATQGVKTVIRAEQIESDAARAVRVAAKADALEGEAESAMKTLTRGTLANGTEDGARLGHVAARGERGALTTLAEEDGELGRFATATRIGSSVVKIAEGPARVAWRTLKQIDAAYQAMPAPVRKLLLRSAFVVMLYIRITAGPQFDAAAFGNSVGEAVGKIVHQAGVAAGEGLAGAARATLGFTPRDANFARITYWVITALLAVLILWMLGRTFGPRQIARIA